LEEFLWGGARQVWGWWFQDSHQWTPHPQTYRALQFDITMHNSNYDELFASKYVEGLKEEIKATVEQQ
jgi:hypothetical protein